MALLTAALAVLPGPAEAAFAFRKPLVVQGSRIVGGPHTDYPVLVSIVDPNLRTVAFGGNVRSASGFDIEFRASDLVTILDHEIERYTPSTGALVAWVRLPTVTNGTNVTIHVYYGDPSVTCARNNPRRVWDASYRYVYHLGENGAANPADSTSNAVTATRNPTANGAIVNAYTATGWIGSALDLQSAPVVPPAGQFLATTPTHLRIADGALAANPAFTMEVWFHVDTKVGGQFYGIHTKGRESGTNWIGSYLLTQGPTSHRFGLGSSAGNLTAGAALNITPWHHGVVSSTGGATPTRTVYIDGTQIATDVSVALPAIAQPTRVGDDSNGNYLDGQVDEVRFSNVARSATWITTTFQNHRCPSQSVFPAGCAAGTHFVNDSGAQVAAGLPAFVNNTAASGLGLTGTKDGGLAWADWNADSCPDVLVNTTDVALRSRLYIQGRSSTCTGAFTDVTTCIAAGLNANTLDRSVIWGDVNNDGRPDFALNTSPRIEVYLNNGPGTTTGGGCPAGGVAWSRFGIPATGNPSQVIDGTVIAGINSEGMGFIDYDRDGDLDLTANNGANGILMLANDGTGALASVAGTGLPTSTPPNGDYGVVADIDGDGDVGILMRMDGERDLWTSGGPPPYSPDSFDLVSDNNNKGGAAFCDLDNEGDLDLIWTDAPSTQVYERLSNGDYVLRPTGGLFTGVDFDGVTCGDIDHDGDVDIVMTAGAPGSPGVAGTTDRIFRNDGGFTFTDVTPAAFGAGDGEGVTLSDYDRDGDLDVLINQWDSTGATANQLWRNERNDRNYVMVRALLDPDGGGGQPPRDAIGATVSLRSCAGALRAGMRDINGGEGHGSQGQTLAHFGLPTTGSPSGPNQVYVVRVRYVGGLVRQKAVVPAALGCYQEVTITSTDADDTAACAFTAVELQSFTAQACNEGVDLRWTTASEVSNLGFHVYRASEREGPYARITGLIPGLGSSPTGATYRHLDTPLANGSTFFYELEDVETGGLTKRHGPVTATPGPGPACQADEVGAGEDSGGGGPNGGDDGQSFPHTRHGDAGTPRLTILERGPTYVVLELITPGFDAQTDADGRTRILVPGFEENAERGAPAVPFRRATVPALAGRHVRLSLLEASDALTVSGLRLAAVTARELEVGSAGVVRIAPRATARAPVLGRAGLYPMPLAHLVRTLYQGDVKKAEVDLFPLRYEAARERVVLHRRLVVRLDFTGRASDERSLGGSRGRRPLRGARIRARGSLVHLATREEGLHAVAFEEVLSGRSVPATALRLSRRGLAVPFRIEPPRATFGPGSMLYFLGGGDLNPHGEAVYELQVGAAGTRMAETDGSPSGAAVEEVIAERVFEQNRFYQAALLEAPDLWLWDLVVSPAAKSYPFVLPGLAPGSWRGGRLSLRLQGASDFEAETDHHVLVSVNGLPVAEASWAGRTERIVEAELPPSLLHVGENTLTLENVADTGAAYSMVFLNLFRVAYPRSVADGVADPGALAGLADEGGTVTAAGFESGALILDTTAPAPLWVRGVTTGPAGAAFRVDTGRTYRVVAPSAVRRPEVRRAGPSHLLTSSNRADWLLVGPRELLPAAAPLVALRRSQGLRVKAVALEDVYAQFGHGEADPQALRLFLAHAYASWRRPSPRYVLLLGDSSYDPKDHLRTGVRDLLPSVLIRTSHLWTASDPSLVAVNGDDLVPDLALGRLPAKNEEEARLLIDKIVAFEQGGHDLQGTGVLVADNPDAGGSFEADAEAMAQGPLAGRDVQRVFVRELGAATRDTIRSALDAGPAVVSYMGHGGTAVWASENVWNVLDVASLTPQARPPLLLTMNCLNGFFTFPSFDALGEAMVKGDARGAIAALSPTGLSMNEAARAYQEAFLRELPRHDRLGDALLAAQAAYTDSGALPELLSIYHLFGDPALRIR